MTGPLKRHDSEVVNVVALLRNVFFQVAAERPPLDYPDRLGAASAARRADRGRPNDGTIARGSSAASPITPIGKNEIDSDESARASHAACSQSASCTAGSPKSRVAA